MKEADIAAWQLRLSTVIVPVSKTKIILKVKDEAVGHPCDAPEGK